MRRPWDDRCGIPGSGTANPDSPLIDPSPFTSFPPRGPVLQDTLHRGIPLLLANASTEFLGESRTDCAPLANNGFLGVIKGIFVGRERMPCTARNPRGWISPRDPGGPTGAGGRRPRPLLSPIKRRYRRNPQVLHCCQGAERSREGQRGGGPSCVQACVPYSVPWSGSATMPLPRLARGGGEGGHPGQRPIRNPACIKPGDLAGISDLFRSVP